MKIDPENVDTYMKSQSKLIGTNEKFHRTMSSFQQGQSRRLSEHKKYKAPPAIQTYYQQDFDTTR